MSLFSSYKFTNKKHPEKAIMASILGAISLVSINLAINIPYWKREAVSLTYGLVGILSLIMAATGLFLAIISMHRKDTYLLFPVIGIVLNMIVLIICGYIVYVGAYGA